MSLTPSFMVAMTRVSPGVPKGKMCNVVSRLLWLRLEVNARLVPSGLQAGSPSCSPPVIGRGVLLPSAVATQTCEKYWFLMRSTRVTTKATCRPSGDTAGDDAWTRLPMTRSAMTVCTLCWLV